MPKLDFRSPRLFVDAALVPGETVALERSQSNYLGNVLRLSAGGTILVFNGRDGEWQASIAGSKRPARLLVFCDEAADTANPLQALRDDATASNGIDILVGPEGGFAEEERSVLLRQPRILRLSLGPRVLRADTAAVAALALVQAVLGDWTAPLPCPDRL